MSGFLEQVTFYLHRVYDDELHRFCIVFPNVRSSLFFKKHWSQLSDKPVWSPAFRSLETLMEETSGLTQTDNLSLIFELFKSFKQHRQTGESFDDFHFWGEMLLEDFDDVDKNLVDARDFAGNKVDVIIYAVEKSLDSYKFNLLHNKQLFITQLKTNNMGARTIDEGTLDEKSGVNFFIAS